MAESQSPSATVLWLRQCLAYGGDFSRSSSFAMQVLQYVSSQEVMTD
jgi:hypothetical protein